MGQSNPQGTPETSLSILPVFIILTDTTAKTGWKRSRSNSPISPFLAACQSKYCLSTYLSTRYRPETQKVKQLWYNTNEKCIIFLWMEVCEQIYTCRSRITQAVTENLHKYTLCGRKLEKYVINYWYMTLNNAFFICVYFVCIDIYETLSLKWISINPCAEWLRHTRIYQISSCYNNYSILESPFLMPLLCYI